MFEDPTKVFPCDCMGEGIAVTKEYDKNDISDNEVMVSEVAWMREFHESPYISLSFWEFGHARHARFTLWDRLKMAFLFVFKKKHFWEDMVTMHADHAKSFANHILYIVTKGEREKKLGEPIVKDGLPVKPTPPPGRILKEGGPVEPAIDIDFVLIEAVEGIHPYFCVQHGGSDGCERTNEKNGLTCPKCDQDKIVEGIKEGPFLKGGIKTPPTTERPKITPSGQPLREGKWNRNKKR